MGGNIVRRLMKHGHTTRRLRQEREGGRDLAAEGAAGANALADFVKKLEKPRTVWVMLPAGEITEETIEALAELLEQGDIMIDGGNSFWPGRRPPRQGAEGARHPLSSTSAPPAASGASSAATA